MERKRKQNFGLRTQWSLDPLFSPLAKAPLFKYIVTNKIACERDVVNECIGTTKESCEVGILDYARVGIESYKGREKK